MSESDKKGLFAKIFGGSKSSCCNIRIEEVSEDGQDQGEQRPPSCCGGASAEPNEASRADAATTKTKKES